MVQRAVECIHHRRPRCLVHTQAIRQLAAAVPRHRHEDDKSHEGKAHQLQPERQGDAAAAVASEAPLPRPFVDRVLRQQGLGPCASGRAKLLVQASDCDGPRTACKQAATATRQDRVEQPGRADTDEVGLRAHPRNLVDVRHEVRVASQVAQHWVADQLLTRDDPQVRCDRGQGHHSEDRPTAELAGTLADKHQEWQHQKHLHVAREVPCPSHAAVGLHYVADIQELSPPMSFACIVVN
mmetsp:Transcript_74930/g.190096  ORF Transcript_74930/g.190096 Transcript_74930/m.190096 type:complete len:239 (-) Transcript_74930:484-1200(-)